MWQSKGMLAGTGEHLHLDPQVGGREPWEWHES